MVLTLSLLLLAAAAPDAGSAAAPLPENSPVAIIWGGGKDNVAAQESLAKWEAEKRLLGDLVTFAEGFPKIVRSDTVPGLTPGFEVVVLGFCPRDEATNVRAYIKALFPSTYEKPASFGKWACLGWKGLSQDAEVTLKRTVKDKGVTTSIVMLALPEEPSTTELSMDPTPMRWLSVVARDAGGSLLGVYSLTDDRVYFGGDFGVGCDTTLKSARAGTVVLDRECGGYAGACTGGQPGDHRRVTLRWSGKAFIAEEKVLKEWEGKNCAE
jgi:hypothetical protein